MAKVLKLVIALAALLAAAPAAAQARSGRFGIGVALTDADVTEFIAGARPGAQLYLPMNIAPSLRIEPQLGWVSVEDDADPTEDFSAFTIGVGVLFMAQPSAQVNAYVGPRVALNFVSDTVNAGGGTLVDGDRTDFRLALAAGGEYLFTPRFSIGAEGQLTYVAVGDTDLDLAGEIPGGSVTGTSALVFFRVYLF